MVDHRHPVRAEVLPGGLRAECDPEISVIIPARNESLSLPELVQRLHATLGELDLPYELLIVDDGSNDGTPELLRRLHADDPRLRARILRSHGGKSAALDCAIRAARGTTLVAMDADLQDLPEEIPVLLDALHATDADLVQGWRRRRKDSWFRVFASWIFNLMCWICSGLRLRDVNCGFKAFRREVAIGLHLEPGLHRFVPILVYSRGGRVCEVPVRHAPRTYGGSRYGIARYFQGFSDLVTVILLPRIAARLQPGLVPIGLLLIAGAATCALWLGWDVLVGRPGALWELGLSTMGLGACGVLSLVLAWLARTHGVRRAKGPIRGYEVDQVID